MERDSPVLYRCCETWVDKGGGVGKIGVLSSLKVHLLKKIQLKILV